VPKKRDVSHASVMKAAGGHSKLQRAEQARFAGMRPALSGCRWVYSLKKGLSGSEWVCFFPALHAPTVP